jgi:hypothetical protein
MGHIDNSDSFRSACILWDIFTVWIILVGNSKGFRTDSGFESLEHCREQRSYAIELAE